MNDRAHPSLVSVDPDDIGHNNSSNPTFESILGVRLSRRALLKGSAGLASSVMLGSALAACGGDGDDNNDLELSFAAVAKSLADTLTVPAGYTATAMFRLGDPINAATPEYVNNGSESGASFASRAGDHHDGMHFFGMTAAGAYDRNASDRGLLVMNHENITQVFLHANGPTQVNNVRTVPDEVLKEMNCHGVSVIEVNRAGTTYAYSKTSAYNRRVTTFTEMTLTGPAGGSSFMKTKFSTDGTKTRGTVNNCANGYTPWGTYLTCEENWAGYFRRAAADNAARTPAEVIAFNRYGVPQGAGGSYNWASVVTSDPDDTTFSRWNASKIGASTDGTDDFRNVANTMGWVVEIDPFNATSTPRKRTALGRMGHEGAWPAPAVAGRPLVYYMGDDSRGEYIYKYVSTANWDPADANGGLAAGDKYLNAGKMYVAKFAADGSGSWVELSLGVNGITSASTVYPFANAADVLVNIRLAADVVGATKMDRPEWAAVDPRNGNIYVTLTNNSQRGSTAQPLDPANPRFYADNKGATVQRGNNNGHIVRMAPSAGDHASLAFTWDVYLFGAQAHADAAANEADHQANVNLSGLTDANDFSSPDGCWFSQATPGLLWLQTDDGAYTDVTNCMLLAALPGTVGDGSTVSVVNKAAPQGAAGAPVDVTISTRVGKKMEAGTLKRFLVGPKGCELTGVAETPDGKAVFVQIQHPGEETTVAQLGAGTFQSNWPQGGSARPRSSTVVITRNDGGKVGLA